MPNLSFLNKKAFVIPPPAIEMEYGEFKQEDASDFINLLKPFLDEQSFGAIQRNYQAHLYQNPKYRQDLQSCFKTIYSKWKQDGPNQLAKEEKGKMAIKLAEGAGQCPPGFLNRVYDVVFSLQSEFSLEHTLHNMRRFLVKRAAYSVSSFQENQNPAFEVHVENDFFIAAEDTDLGVKSNKNDQYHGNFSKEVIQDILSSTFKEHYHPLSIIDQIVTEIKVELREKHGYQGKNEKNEYSYNKCNVWYKTICQYFGDKVKLNMRDIFVLNDEKYTASDIDWVTLKKELLLKHYPIIFSFERSIQKNLRYLLDNKIAYQSNLPLKPLFQFDGEKNSLIFNLGSLKSIRDMVIDERKVDQLIIQFYKFSDHEVNTELLCDNLNYYYTKKRTMPINVEKLSAKDLHKFCQNSELKYNYIYSLYLSKDINLYKNFLNECDDYFQIDLCFKHIELKDEFSQKHYTYLSELRAKLFTKLFPNVFALMTAFEEAKLARYALKYIQTSPGYVVDKLLSFKDSNGENLLLKTILANSRFLKDLLIQYRRIDRHKLDDIISAITYNEKNIFALVLQRQPKAIKELFYLMSKLGGKVQDSIIVNSFKQINSSLDKSSPFFATSLANILTGISDLPLNYQIKFIKNIFKNQTMPDCYADDFHGLIQKIAHLSPKAQYTFWAINSSPNKSLLTKLAVNYPSSIKFAFEMISKLTSKQQKDLILDGLNENDILSKVVKKCPRHLVTVLKSISKIKPEWGDKLVARWNKTHKKNFIEHVLNHDSRETKGLLEYITGLNSKSIAKYFYGFMKNSNANARMFIIQGDLLPLLQKIINKLKDKTKTFVEKQLYDGFEDFFQQATSLHITYCLKVIKNLPENRKPKSFPILVERISQELNSTERKEYLSLNINEYIATIKGFEKNDQFEMLSSLTDENKNLLMLVMEHGLDLTDEIIKIIANLSEAQQAKIILQKAKSHQTILNLALKDENKAVKFLNVISCLSPAVLSALLTNKVENIEETPLIHIMKQNKPSLINAMFSVISDLPDSRGKAQILSQTYSVISDLPDSRGKAQILSQTYDENSSPLAIAAKVPENYIRLISIISGLDKKDKLNVLIGNIKSLLDTIDILKSQHSELLSSYLELLTSIDLDSGRKVFANNSNIVKAFCDLSASVLTGSQYLLVTFTKLQKFLPAQSIVRNAIQRNQTGNNLLIELISKGETNQAVDYLKLLQEKNTCKALRGQLKKEPDIGLLLNPIGAQQNTIMMAIEQKSLPLLKELISLLHKMPHEWASNVYKHKDSNDNNLLAMAAIQFPEALALILKSIACLPQNHAKEILISSYVDNPQFLLASLRAKPEQIEYILSYLERISSNTNVFKALSHRNESGRNCIMEMLVQNNPLALKKIIPYIKKLDKKDQFDLLRRRDSNGNNAFSLAIKHSPKMMQELLPIFNHFDLHQKRVFIKRGNAEGQNIFMQAAAKDAKLALNLLRAADDLTAQDKLELFIQKDKSGKTALMLAAENENNQLRGFLDQINGFDTLGKVNVIKPILESKRLQDIENAHPRLLTELKQKYQLISNKAKRKDKSFMLDLLERDGMQLAYADDTLKVDIDIILTALNQNPKSFKYVKGVFRDDPKIKEISTKDCIADRVEFINELTNINENKLKLLSDLEKYILKRSKEHDGLNYGFKSFLGIFSSKKVRSYTQANKIEAAKVLLERLSGANIEITHQLRKALRDGRLGKLYNRARPTLRDIRRDEEQLNFFSNRS